LLGVDQATVRQVLSSWGPGHFDAELFMDGKAFRPDGKTAAVLIPPAFGPGVNLHTWIGWGSVTYWNAFVAVLEMHGKGNFFDPRLNDATQFPIAAQNGFGNEAMILIWSRRNLLRFISINWDWLLPSHRAAVSTQRRPSGENKCSKDKQSAPLAMCRHCSLNPGGICIRPRKLGSTIFRPIEGRTNATGPHL
jgi:hypothetical protein